MYTNAHGSLYRIIISAMKLSTCCYDYIDDNACGCFIITNNKAREITLNALPNFRDTLMFITN